MKMNNVRELAEFGTIQKDSRKDWKMKANYHYEWFLYTDNLCDGRLLLAQGTKVDCLRRRLYYDGATTIEKHRVYNR